MARVWADSNLVSWDTGVRFWSTADAARVGAIGQRLPQSLVAGGRGKDRIALAAIAAVELGPGEQRARPERDHHGVSLERVSFALDQHIAAGLGDRVGTTELLL